MTDCHRLTDNLEWFQVGSNTPSYSTLCWMRRIPYWMTASSTKSDLFSQTCLWVYLYLILILVFIKEFHGEKCITCWQYVRLVFNVNIAGMGTLCNLKIYWTLLHNFLLILCTFCYWYVYIDTKWFS